MKICEKIHLYDSIIILGDNNNVLMSMPENKLLLTYKTDLYGDSIVECVCGDAKLFKFKKVLPGESNVNEFKS